ncbi:hypothetical protein HUJ05_008268 [Dendroctonus ponderosae]|nr:hypothetical protein HUJ05_008268 [Dendroctonus ponderosae]
MYKSGIQNIPVLRQQSSRSLSCSFGINLGASRMSGFITYLLYRDWGSLGMIEVILILIEVLVVLFAS